jgi:hypothetical protein
VLDLSRAVFFVTLRQSMPSRVLAGSPDSSPGPRAATASRDKTAHIPPEPIGLIVSLQSGNVIESPCFRLKQPFEFHSLV